jgi:PPP family 3-phenylpropionic acid transporter
MAFAALSAFYLAHMGFFNPYLPLWLKSQGLSVATIGMLTAIQSATRLVAPYGWGWLSDHTGERVRLMRYCSAAALLGSAGLLFSGSLWWLAGVLLFMFIHTSAMMPLSEAILVHWVSVDGSFDASRYSRVRLWGSLGFLLTALAAGAWFDAYGMASFAWWAVVSLALVNVFVWILPNHGEATHEVKDHTPMREVLRDPQVIWFLSSVFFHVLSHMCIYVFFSLYLDSLGYSKAMIGLLWAVSVLAEIILFFTQGRWMGLFSLPRWLLVCGAVMVLRMVLTTSLADVLWVLFVAQILHALTFAMHHATCIALLSQYFPIRLRARAQALYASLGYGLPGVLGAFVGGQISQDWGLQSVYAVSIGTALLACACAAMLVRLDARRSTL